MISQEKYVAEGVEVLRYAQAWVLMDGLVRSSSGSINGLAQTAMLSCANGMIDARDCGGE